MEKKPLVSIWSITYNHAKYLSRCLDSIIEQETSFEFEIIIGDDASTDGTSQILIDYAKKYPSIVKPIIHEKNVGVFSNSFESVVPNLNGKYIAICEGDDYWDDPHKLQKQVDFLENNPSYCISFHDCFVVDQEENLLYTYLDDRFKRDLSSFELGTEADIPTQSNVFRNFKELKNPPKEIKEVYNLDDFLYFLLSNHGNAHFHKDINGAYYRKHSEGIYSGAKFSLKLKKGLITKIIIYKLSKERPNEKYFEEKLAISFQNILKMSIKQWNIISIPFALILTLIFKLQFFPKSSRVNLSLAMLRMNWTFNLKSQGQQT